ncbi:MAG: hypothetical protein ACK5KP_12910 [Paludibacteraceae bacterium]
MKTLDLNTYGVREMNATEMRETDGGKGLTWLAIGGYIVDKWDEIKKGIRDAINDEFK